VLAGRRNAAALLGEELTKLRMSSAGILSGLAAVGGQELREEVHQTYPLDKTGTVSLENVNGNVHILTWDREEFKLDAVKCAKEQEHLDEVKIEVDAKGDRIHIKTKYPESRRPKNNCTSVDYTLTVPRQSNLAKISTVNGGIEIENVRGDVEAKSVNGPVMAKGLTNEAELSTVNGSVRASFSEVKKAVSLKSVNGSVTVAVPQETDAELCASTLSGSISCDFAIEMNTHFPVAKNLDARLGKGGPAIKMSSVNGAIRIGRSKPRALEEPSTCRKELPEIRHV
jgi:DUF4097 and DUF4098 domain-containing protein YvlB